MFIDFGRYLSFELIFHRDGSVALDTVKCHLFHLRKLRFLILEFIFASFCLLTLSQQQDGWLHRLKPVPSDDVQGARFNFLHNYVTDHSQLSINLGNDS